MYVADEFLPGDVGCRLIVDQVDAIFASNLARFVASDDPSK